MLIVKCEFIIYIWQVSEFSYHWLQTFKTRSSNRRPP